MNLSKSGNRPYASAAICPVLLSLAHIGALFLMKPPFRKQPAKDLPLLMSIAPEFHTALFTHSLFLIELQGFIGLEDRSEDLRSEPALVRFRFHRTDFGPSEILSCGEDQGNRHFAEGRRPFPTQTALPEWKLIVHGSRRVADEYPFLDIERRS